MNARKVAISYKHGTEDGSRKMIIVDSPVRQVVKLCDIEDSSLLDDIPATACSLSPYALILQSKCPKTEKYPNRFSDVITSADDIHEIKLNNKPKKRKTEVEKLRIENWNPSSGKRSRSQSNFPLLYQPNRQVGRVSIPHPPP